MNCRASTRRIGVYKHVDAGDVAEAEPVLLCRLGDSIEIFARNPYVDIRGEARLFRIPLENVNENAHSTHDAVGNACRAQSCVKAPQSF